VAELAPGTEIAGCRIEAVTGRGGMGVIYRATDLRLHRPVALKLIAADRARDESFRVRFERESRLTAAIEHPNVIPVYGAGEEDGLLYLVMRWVSGTDLRELLSREGRLSPARAAAVIAQLGAGLDAAHEAGLVHRDVKPANVLIAADGHVYLSDFGITRVIDGETRATDGETRATDSGEWVGTVDFMAPEHLKGHPTDARSDVYALGCVLYTALAGTPPFRRETAAATITAHLHEHPPRVSEAAPGVPAEMDRVIWRALAKAPEDRYPSAGDLARAAAAAARGEAITEAERSVARGPAAPASPEAATTVPADATSATRVAPPPPPPTRVHRAGARKRVWAGVFAALLAAAGGAVFLATTAGGERDGGALSRAEVLEAVNGFARAYTRESVPALRAVLAPNVRRVVPGGRQDGRAAVVEEYRRQFAASDVLAYRLSDLEVTGGEAGRATGRYSVSRRGRPPIVGDTVFGVVRRDGEPVIALIAAEPES
jgi:serine/threonine-protein kinase